MALLSLQPPAVFLDCPGEPKIPFAAWKKLFDNYLLAIGGNDFATERKRALLIHCLGMEGQRIYSALPLATDDYEGSVKALETYFHPKVNVVAERYRFRQRAQAVGESTDHYVAALRELVKQCKFGAMENEMLQDQLVEKTNNARIRERLLMEEDLTLDRALEIARLPTDWLDSRTTLEIVPENLPDGLQSNPSFNNWSFPFRTAPWTMNENKVTGNGYACSSDREAYHVRKS
uniref:Retrotransposon gag domain-containing protein n=1 Tax=Haplochromis burtoni TaxID=8153 RepID=A0A3Q2V0A0_HAPBU